MKMRNGVVVSVAVTAAAVGITSAGLTDVPWYTCVTAGHRTPRPQSPSFAS